MCDGISVPPLSKYGDGNDAADGFAETPFLPDGVHYFSEQVLIGNILGLLAVAGALNNLAPETIYFIGSHLAEVVIQRVTRFNLLAINQERTWARDRLPCSSKFWNSLRRPFSSVVEPSSLVR